MAKTLEDATLVATKNKSGSYDIKMVYSVGSDDFPGEFVSSKTIDPGLSAPVDSALKAALDNAYTEAEAMAKSDGGIP